MNYYGNPYNNQFYMQDLQNMRDRIDQQMKQFQQPQIPNTPITQNFQIAPTQTNSSDLEGKFVKDIEEVKNTLVLKTGVFINNDYSTIWIKDATGNIRTFNTTEVIELDEKDKQIIELQKQKEMDNQTISYLQQEIENIKKSIEVENKPKSKGADK